MYPPGGSVFWRQNHVFSTFGHFSKVKSHVFLTSWRLSRFGSKLGVPSPGQKVSVFVFFRVLKILTWIWLIGVRDFRIFRFLGRIQFGVDFRRKSPNPGQKVAVFVFFSGTWNPYGDLAYWCPGDFRIFRFLSRIQFGVDFRRKSPNPGQKGAVFVFSGLPKTNWGERKPAQIWLVLAFSGPFWMVLGGKEPTPTTGELLINFDKIWRNRCFFCENRPRKCPKRPKMFFQILKGFPICFPIYCEPKRSARLKYYRATQDRVISDHFGQVFCLTRF